MTENEYNEYLYNTFDTGYDCHDYIIDDDHEILEYHRLNRPPPYNPEFLDRASSHQGVVSDVEEERPSPPGPPPPPAGRPWHPGLQQSLSIPCLSGDSSIPVATPPTDGDGISSFPDGRNQQPNLHSDQHAQASRESLSRSTEKADPNIHHPPGHQIKANSDIVIETVIFDGECDQEDDQDRTDRAKHEKRNIPPQFHTCVFSARKLAWRTQRAANATRKNAVKLQESPQVAAVLASTQKQLHKTIRRSTDCVKQTSRRAKNNLLEVLASTENIENRNTSYVVGDDAGPAETVTTTSRLLPKCSRKTAARMVKKQAKRASDVTAQTLSPKAKSTVLLVGKQFKRASKATTTSVRNLEQRYLKNKVLLRAAMVNKRRRVQRRASI